METQSSISDDAHVTGRFAMLHSVADRIAQVAAYLAAFCIVALTALILTDIGLAFASRFVMSIPSSTGIGWEYSAYLMGGSFMLGSGMTLRAGQQIRVELLLRVNDGRLARAGELLSALLGTAVTVFLAITMSQFTIRLFNTSEASQASLTPLWIPQSVLSIGAIVLALQMIIRALACIVGEAPERPELGASTQIEG